MAYRGSLALLQSKKKCDWYDYKIPPAKVFLYWAHRHLRKIPDEWRNYYRTLLRQEVVAHASLNNNWESFCAVVNGYRKAQWVLRKYGKEPEPDSIPSPYKDFYSQTTPEERSYAYRRSFVLKDLQASKRSSYSNQATTMTYGGTRMARNEAAPGQLLAGGTRDVRSPQVHAIDLPPPKESDFDDMDFDDEEELIVSTGVEEDMELNPIFQIQRNKQKQLNDLEDMGFED
eukprot:PhF_6_TR38842/c0_g1_i1/m.58084